MRKFMYAAVTAALASSIGAVTLVTSATPQVTAQQEQTTFTCAYFQNPTVELVWSHVCHF